jgi:hypothetical protein
MFYPGFLLYRRQCRVSRKPPLITRPIGRSAHFDSQVERTLYRIHRSVLSRNSPFFRNLFAISAGPETKEVEGSSDESPLHLPHILVDQFDAFLATVYPR